MAATIQHAAGGALLGAASSPAAADFTWRAVAAAAPRLLRLMQHRHASSAPRLLHRHVHRPAVANKQLPAMMGASRSFSSQDHQLQEEDPARTKRKKDLAMALMNDLPSASKGATDHGEEIKGINHLFGLLDVPDAAPSSAVNDGDQAARLHAELRRAVERNKNAFLIELLKDGDAREERKTELIEAGRRYRDVLVGHDERRAFQNLFAEMKILQRRVTSAEHNCKTLSDQVTAGRMEIQSANANGHSVRADVSRLGYQVESIKQDAMAAQSTAESAYTKVERLEESVGQARKEAEVAYGLALFVGGTATVAAGLAALHIF